MKRVKLCLVGLLVLFTILIRIPTIFEPYWYGDEGIYLVLGQMMQRGAILYRDIWDNKPPLLYIIYAISPTLLWAKFTAMIFVAGTVGVIFYFLAEIFKKQRFALALAFIGATVSGILFSLPILEGTIANAELYFTLPIVLGGMLVWKMSETKPTAIKLGVVGFLVFIAFLFKVPALFDFLAFGFFGFILIVASVPKRQFVKQLILRTVKIFSIPVIEFLILLGVVLGYFRFNNALGDFLTASFFQNATYVAVDAGPLAKLSNPLIVHGVELMVFSIIMATLFLKKRIAKELLFLSLWLGFSLYGTLLSNRPYLHYLLQIVPPTVILFTYLVVNIKKYFWFLALVLLVFYSIFNMFKGGFALEPRSYYRNWFDYISERKTFTDFANYFDFRTANSYAIGSYIKSVTGKDDPIFVWGDSAFVYVLSGRPAATKFVQAHHLSTIDRKNYDEVLFKVKQIKPKVIVVTNPIQFPFNELMNYLGREYTKTRTFEQLDVYEPHL